MKEYLEAKINSSSSVQNMYRPAMKHNLLVKAYHKNGVIPHIYAHFFKMRSPQSQGLSNES